MSTTTSIQPSKFKKMDTHLRTLQKKRTANFREDETKLLIQLWGSPSIQNKLFLTHRKAPVMRLLAANMQQRGFYRTPDEIKTRIRNLKCLYHRIKRSMACGTGIGTVDPDWPHFKAMDDILSKEYPRKECDRIMEEALEGTNKNKQDDDTTIQIKQEVDDIDIDDNDSWATNDSINSEYDEDSNPPPPLKPAPTTQPSFQVTNAQPKQIIVASSSGFSLAPSTITTSVAKTVAGHPTAPPKLQTILPAFSLNQNTINANGANKSLPFPLLILNSLPQNTDKNATTTGVTTATANKTTPIKDDGVSILLKELLEVQKENLVIQKEKLDVAKQRLEFDRLIGTQLVTLIPMLGGVLQRLAYPSNQELLDLDLKIHTGKRKRVSDDVDIFKDSKILRNMLEQGIKKYMMFDNDKDSDNEDDSGIQNNDTQSISSDKSGDKPEDV